MRKIRLPQNVVDADVVAQLYANGLEPKINIDLATEKIAGPGEYSFGPKMALLPFTIASF